MTDLDLIHQIEKELNVTLEPLDKIKWNSRGYTLNQSGQVAGLGLYRCEIINLERIISPLRELTNLTQLDLRSTQVSDLAPLCELINLTQLYLSHTQVSDLAPLSELTNLTHLYLPYTQVSDLAPLRELTNRVVPF
jgi:Leucine-rich repeat (LRR) protein